MKDKLLDLLEVRNVIAIFVTITFMVLAFTKVIEPKMVEYVIISVFGFLFGTKSALDKPDNTGDK